jgi:1,4-alpha-glucan branching enzyme
LTQRKGKKINQDDATKTTKELVRYDITLLSDDDLHLFNEGSHCRLYEKLGSHIITTEDDKGTYYAVWAPGAKYVSVIGEFNGWDKTSHPLRPKGRSGIWEGFVSGTSKGTIYKFHIISHHNDYRVDKADPFATYSELSPKTASIVWDIDYNWGDSIWMEKRLQLIALDAPISIYEVHLGSWMRVPEEDNRHLTYRELAPKLADYVHRLGFTHVEFLPIMEHPFYGSWGYQTTGYFAPTSRYGSPQDFMYLIDFLHQNNIGVFLDWVPSHFPNDEHALAFFDGTHLYEHDDPRKGIHPDWNTYIFNYGRHEVRSFLLSSALFWLDYYHIDGLRVDAVASMLYLDYGRKKGQWIPNEYGGRENLEAVAFLRRMNEEIYKSYPDVQTIAEESTAWPMVSSPTYIGGLGFGLKWDMGWMHDTLEYITQDPIHRKYHHNDLTFRTIYAFYENFVLPLSHDEVVHGKASLLSKMPGDDWQKFANLRLLLGYMYAQPGKKLLFMGSEFGQWSEWNHDKSLDWHLLQYEPHQGLQKWVSELNRLFRTEPSLHEIDFEQRGFEWIDGNDNDSSTLSFIRKGSLETDTVLIICNFTPVTRSNYGVGVPYEGVWCEVSNSDSAEFGGSGQGNQGGIETSPITAHGRKQSLNLTLPPLAVIFLKIKSA